MKRPKISVVIPAHNEESCIGDCIKRILSQDYLNKEIIVVNDGSSDRTSEIAKNLGVRVIDFKTNKGLGVARNTAVRESSGDILYFLDADVLIKEKDFLSNIVEDLTDKDIDAVVFKLVLEKPKTFIQKCLGIPQFQLSYGSEKKILSNEPEENKLRGFWVIRKSVFQELGEFNENAFFLEDRYLQNKFYSSGHKALYDPRLVMYDIQPENWSEFMRQSRWLGRGLYEYYRQTGILHYKAILFWWLYLLLGAGSILIITIPLFILMNLLLMAWMLKLIIKSRDVIHSIGYTILHFLRTMIVSTQLAKLFIRGGK